MNSIAGGIQQRPELRSLAVVGLFFLALLTVLYLAKTVFIPLTLATMLSFVFRPLVKGGSKLGLPKVFTAALVMLTLLAGAGFGVARLAEPASQWVERMPKALRSLEAKVRPLRGSVRDVTQIAESVEKMAQVDKKSRTVRRVEMERPSLFETAAAAAGKTISGAIVMVIALFFMLIYGDKLIEKLISFLPDLGEQRKTGQVMERVERDMSGYLGTVTAINLALGVAVGGAMHFLGMPNPLLWGVLAGLVNFVPYLGSLVGVAAVGLAAIVSFPELSDAVLPPLAYFGITAIEGQVVTPLVIGRTFRVSPLVVFIWLVFWAWLWGVAGAIVAVPMLMLIKVTCEQSETLAPIADLMRR